MNGEETTNHTDEQLLDADARRIYETNLPHLLRSSHERIVKAGTSAQAHYQHEEWEILMILVGDIQAGRRVEDEEAETIAVAEAIAKLFRQGWNRRRTERLSDLKKEGDSYAVSGDSYAVSGDSYAVSGDMSK